MTTTTPIIVGSIIVKEISNPRFPPRRFILRILRQSQLDAILKDVEVIGGIRIRPATQAEAAYWFHASESTGQNEMKLPPDVI